MLREFQIIPAASLTGHIAPAQLRTDVSLAFMLVTAKIEGPWSPARSFCIVSEHAYRGIESVDILPCKTLSMGLFAWQPGKKVNIDPYYSRQAQVVDIDDGLYSLLPFRVSSVSSFDSYSAAHVLNLALSLRAGYC